MERARDRLLFGVVASLAMLACSEEPAGDDGAATSASTHGAGGSGEQSSGAGAVAGSTSSGSGASSSAGGGDQGGSGGLPNQGFPAEWIDGTSCGTEPDVMVWQYDADTFILRQSLCTNFEGPFLYLLFGEDRVFLQDTGAGGIDIQGAVATIIEEWLTTNGKPSIELVVTHSHGHGDHVAGDGQFVGQPDTQVVSASLDAVTAFFGITDWPNQIVEFDLGGRTLDIIPIPGHQSAHIAVYDRAQDLLLTGDTLYPGRLYINNWAAYRESIPRLVDFVSSGNPVSWVLGTHVEMTSAPGIDYRFGADQHPDEHPLQLEMSVLLELDQAVSAMGASPQYEVHDHFIVYPL